MALVIDTYNLLHATMPPSLAGLDEMGLCRLLARSEFAGQRMVMVCDGRPKPHAPAGTFDGVEVVYSGSDRTADDVIMELIERDTAPRRLVVVSSDRAIQAAARRRRAYAFSADAFIRLLMHSRPTTSSAPARPTEPLTEEQVEHWLREFGIKDEAEKEDWML